MTTARSPLAAGLASAFRHKRLALVLWLGLVVASIPMLVALGPLTAPFDEGPFRESVMKGWDSWSIMTWIQWKAREWAVALPSIELSIVLAALVNLFLTGGAIRTLLADVKRPVLRRVISESAALFRPTLWAFSRFLVSLAFWEAVLVGTVAWLTKKIAGTDAPPHNGWQNFSTLWSLVVGLLVYFNVSARFDLARIALARDESPTARGAYRVAKERLSGSRASAVILLLAFLVVGAAVQGVFTNLGIRWNPQTGSGVFWLVVVRQLGFIALAMTRVGFWGSLLAWDEARRPLPVVLPSWRMPESRVVPQPTAEPAVAIGFSPAEPEDSMPPPEGAVG